jgi:hypothetical protein
MTAQRISPKVNENWAIARMPQLNARRLDILLDSLAAKTRAIVAMTLYKGEDISEMIVRVYSSLTNNAALMKITGIVIAKMVSQNIFGWVFG